MIGTIRVVLVDPVDESRQALQRLLGGISSVWLAEACGSYEAGARSVADNAPDLVIVSADGGPDAAIELIGRVARERPEAAVLPASRQRDGDLILRMVRAGAREFLGLPAAVDELLGAIDRLAKPGGSGAGPARRGSKVIAIAGAAGGVGCTTLAVNVGAELARDPDHAVVLADFDLLFGAVDTCLDMIPTHTLLDVSRDVDRLDLTLLKRAAVRHATGLHVLPRPSAMEEVSQIEPEALRRVLGLLKAAFHTVVIDTSKGLQATDFVAFEAADVILLTVHMDLTCLRNTVRLLALFRQFELIDKVKVVANRVGSCPSEVSLKKAEEALKLTIAHQVPDDLKVFSEARARGVTLGESAKGGKPHRAILEIARALSPGPAATAAKAKGRIAAMFF